MKASNAQRSFGGIKSAVATAPGSAAEADRSGRLSVWIFVAWLSTGVVEGPLRGALAAADLPNILYVRDLVVVCAIALTFVAPLFRKAGPPPGLAFMAGILILHLCIGIFLSGTFFGPFFGLKIFLAMMYTIAISPAIIKHFRLFVRAMMVFFVISTAGVYANFFVGEWPWEGFSYATVFGTVQTTKKWWMEGGIVRLAGLSRTSFDAAMIIGVTGVILLSTAKSKRLRFAIAALAIGAILLTTSKAMVLAFGVASLWLVAANRTPGSFKVGRLLCIVLFLLTCVVPTVFMVVSVQESPVDSPPALLLSLWDRFSWMWPSAYALLPDRFGALTGAGLGGIGTPLGELLSVPNTADNVFVYYYVNFGLVGLAYLAFPLVAVLSRKGVEDRQSFVWLGLLVIAYGYGLTTNMIEQPFFTSVFGLIYAKAFQICFQRRAFAIPKPWIGQPLLSGKKR